MREEGMYIQKEKLRIIIFLKKGKKMDRKLGDDISFRILFYIQEEKIIIIEKVLILLMILKNKEVYNKMEICF